MTNTHFQTHVFTEVACQTASEVHQEVKETACQSCPVGLQHDTIQPNLKPPMRGRLSVYYGVLITFTDGTACYKLVSGIFVTTLVISIDF